MREKKIILALTAMCSSLCAMAQGAADLAATLLNADHYIKDARFEVLLPSAMDPVVYDITLQSEANQMPDSLSPCRYLIRWRTETKSGEIQGFSAYYDGNHYRYRNNRLQEYHAESNINPFMPLGPGSQLKNGVQATAQFADMLPQFIGIRINEIINDTSYIYKYHPDTLINGKRRTVVDGVKRGNGFDQQVFSYVFDKDTKMPVMTELETSPGSISEQIVTITYSDKSENTPIEISEAGLIEAWPDVFEKYRESTFRAENLVNTPLPTFSCQSVDGGERYTHHINDSFTRPLAIVILDADIATTPDVISSVREAIDMAPMDIDVVWAFNSNQSQQISEIVGRLRQGETALMSANTLVRNCGITLFPTILLVDKASKVRDVITGFNNDTSMIVLQKAMLLK